MKKERKNLNISLEFSREASSSDPKNKNLLDKVFSFCCVFQSLRKRTPKKYIKKTILNDLCAKKRPILVQKVSSQPFLGINKVKIMSNLYSIAINRYDSVTQRLYLKKIEFGIKNEVLFQ